MTIDDPFVKALVLSLAALASAAEATSRMPAARVDDDAGVPCLSIPSEELGDSPARVYSIVVSELRSKDWRSLPEALWTVRADEPSVGFELKPGTCFPYGRTPPGATAATPARALSIGRIYGASLNARVRGSETALVYRKEFCVQGPADSARVAAIPWDEAARRWRYDLCSEGNKRLP